MTMRINLAAAAALALASALALAEQPPPAVMPSVPPATCVKPELPPTYADPRRMASFTKDFKGYGECVKKYVEDTNGVIAAAAAAGKKAIDEYNALAAELKAREADK